MNDLTNPKHNFLSRRYSGLWNDAVGSVRSGQIKIDPILALRIPDQRRGLTVIARPDETTKSSSEQFLNQLRHFDPQQYYYHPSEFHVTVLSLFTAKLDPAPQFAQSDQYFAAVQAALANVPAFTIEFRGLTMTEEAVMIQGFPETDVLDKTRENLRKELKNSGLIEGLDTRYKLQTAHMTVVRFKNSLANPQAYVDLLEQNRSHVFGRALISELHLVRNDWYMSRSVAEVLQRFPLL
jgi:2'-5' RNA ligase